MARRGRDEAGNIWELDDAGNPVRLVQPAAAPSPGAIPGALGVVPPNPAILAQKQRDEARQNAADARAERSDQRAAAAEARAEKDFESKDTMVPPPGDTTKTGEDYLATIPPSLAGQAKALSEGRRAFPTGSALRSPAVQQLIAAATQYDPTLDATNSVTRVATRKDFTSGKSAQNITALNTALGHIGQLWQDAQALHNRGLVPWNALANAVESTAGDPRLNNFNLARKAVADELERVFRQSGGNVSEINEWKSTLSSSSSPDQFRGAMAQAVGLLNSRLESLGAQYQQGMGQSKDPITFLKPHAQAVFSALQDGGSGIIGDDKAAPPAIGGGGPKAPPPGGLGGPGSIPKADYSSMVGGPQSNVATMDPNSKLGVFKQTFRNEYDPVMAGAMSAFIRKGTSYDTVAAYLQSHGITPSPELPNQYAAAVAFQKQHPNATPNVEANRSVPTTLGERLSSSPLAASIVGAGTAATAGLSDVLGRSVLGPEWDANRAALAATNPKADLAGNVVGGVGAAIAAPELLARYAPGALGGISRAGAALDRLAPGLSNVAADAAYGGVYGASENPDDPIFGGLTGAITGAGGGLVGRRATRGLANVIAPPAGAFGPTYAQGVFPTIGQRFGRSGIVGRALNTIEQAMQSFPGLGAMVARARDIPRDAAQLGAFNEALGELKPFDNALPRLPDGRMPPPISSLPAGVQPGPSPHVFAQQAFAQAYPLARSGMLLVPGDAYKTATQDFASKWFPLLNSEQKSQLSDLIKGSVTSRIKAGGGMMDGAAYQHAASDIGSAAQAWGKSDPLLAQATGEYGGILDDAARASSDPQAAALLDAADRGYNKYAIIRNAAKRPGGEEPGEFTMKAFDRSVQNSASGPDSSQYLRGKAPMQDYSRAIQPLGDVLSNSGTGERLMTNRLFMGEQGAAGVGGLGLGLGGAMMAHPGALAPFLPYVPGANAIIARAIAPRQYVLPPVLAEPLNLAGSKLNDIAPFIGKGAVPGALAYFGNAQ